MSAGPTAGSTNGPNYRRFLVLALFAGISVAFLWMVRDYLMALLLAAIFSTLLHPVYRRVVARCGRRRGLASALVLIGFVVAIGLPLVLMIGLVANEAVMLSKTFLPWLEQRIGDRTLLTEHLPDWLPFADALDPFREQIKARLADATRNAGGALFSGLTQATGNAIDFGIGLFVFLYAMFFFLMRGADLILVGLRYLPLDREDREEVVARGINAARATMKSILIIGLLQGVLIGLAFWVVGIKGAIFWGTVVVVLAAVPALGTPLVWGPAAVYLFINGQTAEAIGLVVWGVGVIGLIDNILRPRLVGEEAKLPDLIVLISILGGISVFGIVGIIAGPVLATVFFVVLDIYRHTFADALGGADERS
jgi:predicted PurR-regulated permease PerM